MAGRKKNFWVLMAEHPPIMVRLLAKEKTAGKCVSALSSREIAIRSGIPLTRLHEIERSAAWNDITFHEAQAFCLACGFDPCKTTDRNRLRAYQRQAQNHPTKMWWKYLLKSPLWKTEIKPLAIVARRIGLSLTAVATPGGCATSATSNSGTTHV